ncbi:hypothetical protein JW752_03835 [Candidatus Peregrinibacteria bacterium]|nr:hypothetical protein [Candidatus Peregrinibacteria bacterium]
MTRNLKFSVSNRTRNLKEEATKMAQTTKLLFAVAAMVAAVLFSTNPVFAQQGTCNKRDVLSDASAQTVLVSVTKKGDYCTPYLANKAAVDKALSDAGCTPADFKADFSACNNPPAPADKGKIASKACKKAPMLNEDTLLKAWLGAKASDCDWQNANRDKLVADLAAHQCSPADFADNGLELNRCSASPADKGKVADKTKPVLKADPLQGQLLALRGVNVELLDVVRAMFNRLADLIPQNTSAMEDGKAALGVMENKNKARKTKGQFTIAIGATEAVLNVLNAYDRVFRDMQGDFAVRIKNAENGWENALRNAMNGKRGQDAAINAARDLYNQKLGELHALSTSGTPEQIEKARGELAAALGDLQKLIKDNQWAFDGDAVKTLLKKAEDTLASLDEPTKTQLSPFVDNAKKAGNDEERLFQLARFFSALPTDKFNEVAGINSDCPEPKCSDTKCPEVETRLSKFNHGHVGNSTVTAWFTHDGKPLLPSYVNLYAGITYAGFNGSHTQSFRGISGTVEHEGFTIGGILGLDLEWNIISELTLFAGFHMELAHRETLVYDSRSDGESVLVDHSVFQAGGRVGLNLFGWVSAYFRAYGQPNPDGWGLLGGLELTGLDALFVALEGGKHFSLDGAPTNFTGGEPINPDGPMFRVLLGLRF